MLKSDLLRVQLSTASGNSPVSLMAQCMMLLQHTPNIQTRIGLLMFLSTWVTNCPQAVQHLVSVDTTVPFLTGQIGSNEHDDLERLGQGICAYLLGLCSVHNDNFSEKHGQDQLYQLMEKRIGFEVFLDKLSEVTKHEAYNKALKHPQPKSQESKDLIFDHAFCKEFKHHEHVVLQWLHKRRDEGGQGQDDIDPAIVIQYKEVIREQDVKIAERDTRIADLTKANMFLQQELENAKSQIDELNSSMQTLQDMNQVLKAQNPNATVLQNAPTQVVNSKMSDHW